MTKLIKQLIPFITLCLIACNEDKKDDVKETIEKNKSESRTDKRNALDSLNKIAVDKLIENYKAVKDWDTAECFTYTLQEKFDKNSNPISFIGEINDITKKDSVYILKLTSTHTSYFTNFTAQISVNPSVFEELKLHITRTKYRNEGCFIFKVNAINTYLPTLKSVVDKNGDNSEDATSSLSLDFDEKVLEFKGNLISYYLYKDLKDDD